MELDCGIACKRIEAWLDNELSLPREGDAWMFSCDEGSCRVEAVAQESRTLGTIALERTLVRVEGNPPATEAFMRLFTLRFMSAGG